MATIESGRQFPVRAEAPRAYFEGFYQVLAGRPPLRICHV